MEISQITTESDSAETPPLFQRIQRVTGLYSGNCREGKTDESRVTHLMTAVVAAASDLGTSQ